ncbi:MAG: hypothetical protein M1831_007452 [Alyxoria varia]|nr:MAG: hypothetical protein M1831_007452 [Alyxoria varia]
MDFRRMQICNRMLSLQQTCLHPETKAPYIKTSQGGRDNSPESAQQGMTHGFVMSFASEADRTYYVTRDPVHLSFKNDAEEVVEKATVLDFLPGVL